MIYKTKKTTFLLGFFIKIKNIKIKFRCLRLPDYNMYVHYRKLTSYPSLVIIKR